jgi:hypothetical protein
MPRCFLDGEVVVDSRHLEKPPIMSCNVIWCSSVGRTCFSSVKIASVEGARCSGGGAPLSMLLPMLLMPLKLRAVLRGGREIGVPSA